MPRSFDLVAESPATVEQVHSAFSDEDYWLARLAAFGGADRLDSLIVDHDGTVTVATTQDLGRQALSGVLRVLPGDLNILRKDARRRGDRSVAAGSGGRSACWRPEGWDPDLPRR
jgi:hypothetical protein